MDEKNLPQQWCFNWECHSLSDPVVLDILIRLNAAFNPSYSMAKKLDEKYVYAYVDLMDIVGRCNFTDSQRKVLDMMLWGMTWEDVAEETGATSRNIIGVYKSILKKIIKANDEQWQIWAEVSGNAKLPPGITYKRCPRCGRDLRMTADNFGTDGRNSDGLTSLCKRCDSYRKKPSVK